MCRGFKSLLRYHQNPTLRVFAQNSSQKTFDDNVESVLRRRHNQSTDELADDADRVMIRCADTTREVSQRTHVALHRGRVDFENFMGLRGLGERCLGGTGFALQPVNFGLGRRAVGHAIDVKLKRPVEGRLGFYR